MICKTVEVEDDMEKIKVDGIEETEDLFSGYKINKNKLNMGIS